MKKLLLIVVVLQLLLINDTVFGNIKKKKLYARVIVNTEDAGLMKTAKKELLRDLKSVDELNLVNYDKNILIAVSVIDNDDDKASPSYSLVTHLFYCEDVMIGEDIESNKFFELFKGSTKNYKVLNSYYFEGNDIKNLCSSTSRELNFDLCNINQIAMKK